MQIELEQQESYRLFSRSIRSDETRKTYTLLLKKFIEYLMKDGRVTSWSRMPNPFLSANLTLIVPIGDSATQSPLTFLMEPLNPGAIWEDFQGLMQSCTLPQLSDRSRH